MAEVKDENDGVAPAPGVRVYSLWPTHKGMKGTIIRAYDSFAYVKWDDPNYGGSPETSEDYSFIEPFLEDEDLKNV